MNNTHCRHQDISLKILLMGPTQKTFHAWLMIIMNTGISQPLILIIVSVFNNMNEDPWLVLIRDQRNESERGLVVRLLIWTISIQIQSSRLETLLFFLFFLFLKDLKHNWVLFQKSYTNLDLYHIAIGLEILFKTLTYDYDLMANR